MARLFDWVYRITVVSRATGFIGSNPQFFNNTGNAIEFSNINGEGPRMAFEVKRSLGKEPNTCKLKLDNLNDSTRALLDRKPLGLVLAAGYRDTGPRVLFSGDVMNAFTELKGVNYETIIQVADGGRAYKYGRMRASYKSPVRLDLVLQECARSLGISIPASVLALPQVKQQLPVGLTLHGPTREVLDTVLDPIGLNWSLQNGKLQIIPDGGIKPGQAYAVNKTTGLIGSPKRSIPTSPKAKSELTCELMLWPEMLPAEQIQLKSRDFDGTFRIKELEAQGDTFGDDWKTKLKCT